MISGFFFNILHVTQAQPSHLSDAAVGEFAAGREVELLQPAESQKRSSSLLFELLQVSLRHQLGSLLKRQTRRFKEAHVAKRPSEPGPLVSLWRTNILDQHTNYDSSYSTPV